MSLLHSSTRRDVLLGTGALFAWAYAPKLARAEGRDPRVLVIVLRGALDGLAMVAPVGDPGWVGLRGDRALVLDGKPSALPLDSFFALNPAMPNLYRLYRAQQATIVHAAATPYRERSHFDGQDVLESGLAKPGKTDSGWLNRALSSLEADGRVNPRGSRAFAVGPVTPLVVRGPAPVMSWAPQRLLPASDDTQMRLLDLYRHTDTKLARAFEGRRALFSLARDGGMDTMTPREGEAPGAGMARLREYVATTAGAAAKYLAQPDGPRVGAAGFVGWDTHINEGAADGQLAALLGALDAAIAAIEKAMSEAWSETVVAVITEFGRTARINGTDGTDHGTGTVAVLAGGALKGGRVIADWPGLKPADLHEGRDLKPTIDLRAVLKGVLKDHLRVDEQALDASVFPASDDVRPMAGLFA
jgi:uncharacterized protein (DUF1501 family)